VPQHPAEIAAHLPSPRQKVSLKDPAQFAAHLPALRGLTQQVLEDAARPGHAHGQQAVRPCQEDVAMHSLSHHRPTLTLAINSSAQSYPETPQGQAASQQGQASLTVQPVPLNHHHHARCQALQGGLQEQHLLKTHRLPRFCYYRNLRLAQRGLW
jgi:hypothetical protein